ncbi:MAG: hypothetical protein AB1480_16570 [Nitrospirota bacterium]
MNDLYTATVISHREQKFPVSGSIVRFNEREFSTRNIFSNILLEDFYTILGNNSDGFYNHQIIAFHLATPWQLCGFRALMHLEKLRK